MKTKSILFTGTNQVEIGEVEIPSPGPGEVLIETQFSVVSPGTELRCLAGEQPDSRETPYIPGYSMMGRIVETGPDVGLSVGDLVYSSGTRKANVGLQWGGHVGYALSTVGEVYLVPPSIDPVTAGMAHLAAIALRGVRLTRPTLYDTVAVLGLGPIGQLSARLFAATDAKTVAVDLVPERVTAAQHAGIRAVNPDGDPADAVRSFFPHGADIVVDATGSATAICSSIRAAKDKPWDDTQAQGARIVVQGSYASNIPIPYQEAFSKELSFLLPRACQPSDVRLALELMADGRLKTGDLISRVYAPEEAPRAYEALANREPNLLTIAFQWTS